MAKAKSKLKGAPKAVGKRLKGAVSKAMGGVTAKGGVARGGRRRRKHGAMWYAKEIARIKLKRRYDKIRLRV